MPTSTAQALDSISNAHARAAELAVQTFLLLLQ